MSATGLDVFDKSQADYLEVLLAMGPAALDKNGGTSLTIGGQQRLRAARAEQAAK
jgi:hypothetical protein